MKNSGSYYKIRTKDWLEKKGYQVAFLERMMRLYVRGQVIFTKKDQFASDLLAVNENDVIFVQVKFNKKAKNAHVAEAIKEFHKFKFPKFVKKWIVVWGFRQREPQIIEC